VPLKVTSNKTKMFRTLLKDQALSYFEHHLRNRLGAEDSEIPYNYLQEIAIRDIGVQ
jgi:hypothetical protein